MMKLKNIIHNEELAIRILGNWEYDPDSLDILKYFRISSNAIYPFKTRGSLCFLRFAPLSEKSPDNVSAELDFLEYLRNSGYSAVEPAPSRNGNNMEVLETPWGGYVAAAFKGVPGVQMDKTGFMDDIVFGYGASLGKLHKLSAGYLPKGKRRWSWKDALDWSCDVLSGCNGEEAALLEADLLKEYLSKLPVSSGSFGLIHYDFEADNVFYDAETKEYYPIDFDDAMVHWYAMDIEQAVESIRDEIEPENHAKAERCFIDGYRSQVEVSEDMLSLLPVFRRFANLYGYTRILYSTKEYLNYEPEWMTDLRKYLDQLKEKRTQYFGNRI